MINQKEYKKKVKNKIEEISAQIQNLRYQVVEASLKNEFEALIRELEGIRDRIQAQYDEMEESGEEQWNKVDKNIYADVKSSDTAFKKAGSMFKPTKGSSG